MSSNALGAAVIGAERETVPHAADVCMMAHLHVLRGVRTVPHWCPVRT